MCISPMEVQAILADESLGVKARARKAADYYKRKKGKPPTLVHIYRYYLRASGVSTADTDRTLRKYLPKGLGGYERGLVATPKHVEEAICADSPSTREIGILVGSLPADSGGESQYMLRQKLVEDALRKTHKGVVLPEHLYEAVADYKSRGWDVQKLSKRLGVSYNTLRRVWRTPKERRSTVRFSARVVRSLKEWDAKRGRGDSVPPPPKKVEEFSEIRNMYQILHELLHMAEKVGAADFGRIISIVRDAQAMGIDVFKLAEVGNADVPPLS